MNRDSKQSAAIFLQRCIIMNNMNVGDRAELVDSLLEKNRTIFHICLGFTANPVEAEELAQDIYLKAIARLHTLKDVRTAVPWLLRIARNVCLNHIRRERLTRRIFLFKEVESGDGRTPEIENDFYDRIVALKKAVSGLPEKNRLVFILFEYGDLSYEEIASCLNIQHGTVMSRLHRARNRLKKLLSDLNQGR